MKMRYYCNCCGVTIGRHYSIRDSNQSIDCPWCGKASGIRSNLFCQDCIETCIICDEYFCPECRDQCNKCEAPMCIKCASDYSNKLCINCYRGRKVDISTKETEILEKLQSKVGKLDRLNTMTSQSRGFIVEDPNIVGINLTPEYFKDKISLIPNELFYFENLIVLGLASNEIETLPEELKYLTKLEIFDLRDNPIKNKSTLSVLDHLPNLKNVYISGYSSWELYEDPRLRDNYGLITIQDAIMLKEHWQKLSYKDITITGRIIKAPYQFDSEIDRYERPKFVIRDKSNKVKICIINQEWEGLMDRYQGEDYLVFSKLLRPSETDEYNGIDFLIDARISIISSIRPCDRNRQKIREKRESKVSKKMDKSVEVGQRITWGLKSDKDAYFEGDDWDRIDHKEGFEYGDQS